MAVSLPDGSVLSIVSGYEAAAAMSQVSNNVEAKATLAAGHNVADGDIVEVTSGWAGLSGRIVRAKDVASNELVLENINTTDDKRFPAGSGAGSVRKVSGWVQVPQVLEFESSGGDTKLVTYQFLEENDERQIPTGKSAVSITFSIADDPSLPCYEILSAADADRIPRAFSLQLANGSKIYYNGYVSFNRTPSLTKGQIMAVKVTLSLVSELSRY